MQSNEENEWAIKQKKKVIILFILFLLIIIPIIILSSFYLGFPIWATILLFFTITIPLWLGLNIGYKLLENMKDF